jgi:hypothetical protein
MLLLVHLLVMLMATLLMLAPLRLLAIVLL